MPLYESRRPHLLHHHFVPAGQRCDIAPNTVVCRPPANNGTRCQLGTQCLSGFRVDNFCCGSLACVSGEFCNTGACDGPAGNGTPCNNGEQCGSGNCVDSLCSASASCPSGQACNVPGSEGLCTATTPNGTQTPTATLTPTATGVRL